MSEKLAHQTDGFQGRYELKKVMQQSNAVCCFLKKGAVHSVFLRQKKDILNSGGPEKCIRYPCYMVACSLLTPLRQTQLILLDYTNFFLATREVEKKADKDLPPHGERRSKEGRPLLERQRSQPWIK